jgi:hypothetical protein
MLLRLAIQARKLLAVRRLDARCLHQSGQKLAVRVPMPESYLTIREDTRTFHTLASGPSLRAVTLSSVSPDPIGSLIFCTLRGRSLVERPRRVSRSFLHHQ